MFSHSTNTASFFSVLILAVNASSFGPGGILSGALFAILLLHTADVATDAHRLMRDRHRRQILNRLRHDKNEDASAKKTRIMTVGSIASRPRSRLAVYAGGAVEFFYQNEKIAHFDSKTTHAFGLYRTNGKREGFRYGPLSALSTKPLNCHPDIFFLPLP